jgi:NAD-dependent deacetylase
MLSPRGGMMENLIKKAANDLVNAKYAIALTGAGMSTESGIPDFRGPKGVWTKNPEAERKAFRSYEKFTKDPKGWWIERLTDPPLLGGLEEAMPNPGHYALAELEKLDLIKCVITQNVDALHEKAGNKNLIEYHGNALKLRCIACGRRFSRDDFDLEVLLKQDRFPPTCFNCNGIVKSDSVAFGEPIPINFAQRSLAEVEKCDFVLICGTSATVYPFANLPRMAKQKKSAIIIEINAETTPLTYEGISEYLIQGKTGEILPKIVAEIKNSRNFL